MQERLLFVRSYAAALWLVAKNFRPLDAEMAKDGSGGVVFTFPQAAQDALNEFYAVKDELNAMSLVARGIR